MAASGFTPISLYYSTTASAVPTSGNLANGELGLNIADMKLYAKNSAGTVTLLASNAGASGSVTSVAVSGGTTGLTTSGGPITTSGTITLAGTLATTNGGTGLTSFTSGGVVYASSTSALATGSALSFDGTNLGIGTTSPSSYFAKLAVVSTAADTRIAVVDDVANARGGYLRSNFSDAVVLGTTSGVRDIVFAPDNTARLRITTAGAFGIGATPSYGTAGQVLTSGGSGAPPTWTTNGAGTVTSITVAAGTGMSGGGTVTTSGTVTLTNAGVTSVTGGTGISVSASTGSVTITSTAASGAQAFVAFGSTGGI